MKDSEADIAIGVLNKLIDQELEAVRAATRDGNTPFGGYAQTRHNAFLYARDEIRKALAAADQAQPASADGSDYEERMRVEYRELTARAGGLRGMLQRYADGTLDFEPTCPITLLSRQLDVMDEYANLLRHRAKIEHVDLEEQDSAT